MIIGQEALERKLCRFSLRRQPSMPDKRHALRALSTPAGIPILRAHQVPGDLRCGRFRPFEMREC
jgi:hypothetical protein